jgi:hypothetical protein
MDRQIYQQRARLAQFSCREIFREQEIADVQSIVKRACKTGTDQTIELPILKKLRHPLPADFFSDAGMNNFNRAAIDLAADYPDAIAISFGFFVEATQKS